LSDISNYIFYIFQRPGGVLYTDVSVLPNASQPITITVLLISINIIIQNLNASLGVAIPEIPESIIQIVNLGTYYTVFLVLTMIPLLLLMLIHVKDDRNLRQYWSKMLFLTLLLMICLHLFSPRGIYKYYCVALIPFFSILPVSKMITQKSEKMKLSIFMILNPLAFSILILFPSRYIYLVFLLLILIAYLSHKQFSIVLELLTDALRGVSGKLRTRSQESSKTNEIQSVNGKLITGSSEFG
ncbi:MAG: hypothetical protein KAU48_08320, partial [Candidatus Thorarchaeota archaeon]|nr:hypothetical protein [Candidatus Thorarchaeota archaeon]